MLLCISGVVLVCLEYARKHGSLLSQDIIYGIAMILIV